MGHTIEFEIEDADWPNFKKYFLMTHPNQTLESQTPLSQDQWVEERIRLFARGAYEKGLRQEFSEQNPPPLDPDIITRL